jgi:hypothetical protein
MKYTKLQFCQFYMDVKTFSLMRGRTWGEDVREVAVEENIWT